MTGWNAAGRSRPYGVARPIETVGTTQAARGGAGFRVLQRALRTAAPAGEHRLQRRDLPTFIAGTSGRGGTIGASPRRMRRADHGRARASGSRGGCCTGNPRVAAARDDERRGLSEGVAESVFGRERRLPMRARIASAASSWPTRARCSRRIATCRRNCSKAVARAADGRGAACRIVARHVNERCACSRRPSDLGAEIGSTGSTDLFYRLNTNHSSAAAETPQGSIRWPSTSGALRREVRRQFTVRSIRGKRSVHISGQRTCASWGTPSSVPSDGAQLHALRPIGLHVQAPPPARSDAKRGERSSSRNAGAARGDVRKAAEQLEMIRSATDRRLQQFGL